MGVENFSQTSKRGGQKQIFKKGIKEWERGGGCSKKGGLEDGERAGWGGGEGGLWNSVC